MIEPKNVQFNIINETAEETSINLFNVNTLLDVPQSLVYEDSSVATISSDNLINSVINPINGDIFTYSNDNNVVSIYDSSLDTLLSMPERSIYCFFSFCDFYILCCIQFFTVYCNRKDSS